MAKFSKGKGISKSDINESGTTECIRYGELYTYYGEVIEDIKSRTNNNQTDLLFSEANDVIIPASGETQIDIATASCVLKSGVALGGDLNIIKTLNNGIFLSYYLNSKKKTEIAKLAQGYSVVHLYSSQLSLLKLGFPCQKEQTKIANFLTLLDKRIETQSKIIKNLESLMLGLRQKIFSQQLRFNEDNGSGFPNWETKRLGEVCEIIGGGTPPTNKKAYWGGNIQWFTPTEIKENYVSKSERTITKLGLEKSSAKLLPEGTILLTTRATIGEVAIAIEECTTNQGFQSLVVNKHTNNNFIFNWVRQNKRELIKRANGSTFSEISKSEIEKILITLPCFKEQNEIASFLSSFDEKIEKEELILTQYQQQKKYLLQNLFI